MLYFHPRLFSWLLHSLRIRHEDYWSISSLFCSRSEKWSKNTVMIFYAEDMQEGMRSYNMNANTHISLGKTAHKICVFPMPNSHTSRATIWRAIIWNSIPVSSPACSSKFSQKLFYYQLGTSMLCLHLCVRIVMTVNLDLLPPTSTL